VWVWLLVPPGALVARAVHVHTGGRSRAPQGHPQEISAQLLGGRGPLGLLLEGQMGQKVVRFAELGGMRSRQDASKEVHESGRIRACPLVDWADLRLVIQ
jgi:hypothetical protein